MFCDRLYEIELKLWCFYVPCRIKSMTETGILLGLQRKYRNVDACSTQAMTTAQALELSKVVAAFIVLGVGITTSMIVLVVEICCRDLISIHLVPIFLNKLRTVNH